MPTWRIPVTSFILVDADTAQQAKDDLDNSIRFADREDDIDYEIGEAELFDGEIS